MKISLFFVDILQPVASGTIAEETDRAVIDYSNTADGYVMVRVKEGRKDATH